MENTSNNSPGANLGVGGDLSAPGADTGFGLEDQSSTMPSMPTMMATSPDPVSLAGEESTVFKEEPSLPAAAPAQAPAAAPSPDEQVLHGLCEEFNWHHHHHHHRHHPLLLPGEMNILQIQCKIYFNTFL